MQCSTCQTITLEPTMNCPQCGAVLPAAGFLTSIMRVEEQIRLARYDEAGPELVKAEAQLKRTALAPEARRIAEARLLADHARVLFFKSHYKQAEQLAQQALDLLGDTAALALLRASALSTLASIANYHDNPTMARQYADQALIEARQAGEPFILGTVLNGAANTTRARGDNDTALQLYQQALLCAEEAGTLGLAASVCGNMSTIYQERGETRTSLSFSFKALKLAEQVGDELRISYITTNLGVAYFYLGEMEAAETYLQKAFRIMQDRQNTSQYSHVYTNLAELAWLSGDYAAAFERADTITSGDFEDYRGHVLCYAIQVHSAVKMGEMNKARQSYVAMQEEEALRPTPSSNDFNYLVLTAPAALKLGEGDWQGAQADFIIAMQRADEQGDVHTQAQVRIMYADALITHQTGSAGIARHLLEEAIQCFTKMGAMQNVQRVNLLLASLPTD